MGKIPLYVKILFAYNEITLVYHLFSGRIPHIVKQNI